MLQLPALLTFALLTTTVLSWGPEGHEITAAIAQIHLLPSTLHAISNILPKDVEGRIARVAVWADEVKKEPKYKWSSDLHFVNPIADSPPESCIFGEEGWESKNNILYAIVNYTRKVESCRGEERDHALRFLIHFLGDVHTPLHTTGKERGGDKVPVMFEGQNTTFHMMWDRFIISQRIRTLPNYTWPLPSYPTPSIPPSVIKRNRQIEDALDGSAYDPYVRFIVLEGIYGWWADQLTDWTTCPQLNSQAPDRTTSPGQAAFSTAQSKPPFKEPTDVPVCPYHWATSGHQLLCDYIWPAGLSSSSPRQEMNTPEYAGLIESEKTVEKQLALGGLRLAKTLNLLLGNEEEKRTYGALPFLF